LAKLPPRPGPALILCGLTLLAACATPERSVTSGPPERSAIPNSRIISGTIVAIRPITGHAAPSPGALGVLAALQIAPPAEAPDATEFVIRRSDGNVAAIVVPAPASSPTASMSGGDFAVGDQVELITGNPTELIHGTP